MNKHMLVLFAIAAQNSNAACVYRSVVKGVSYFKTSSFSTKYSQATQLWYHQQFSKLSELDKDLCRTYFKHSLNNSTNTIGSFHLTFGSRLKKLSEIHRVKNLNNPENFSPEFNDAFEHAENVLKSYNNDKNFGLNICAKINYPLLNRDLGHAITKLNDACNAEFDKAFAEFKLERTLESLTAFGQLVNKYYSFLETCQNVMNEQVK